MRSSPADPAGRLRALAHNWDGALEAVLRDDLERASDLLAANQELLAGPSPGDRDDPELAALHATAMEAHGRLIGTLRSLHKGVREELTRVRLGRRALSGYAQAGRRPDSRFESRA